MNTPNKLSDTPRTDLAWAKTFEDDDDQCRAGNAASDMRDCSRELERELVTFTSAYTCTHHNDQQRAACPVCLVAALTAERDQLRAENTTLRAAQKSCEACDEPTAFEVRQLRAEMERLRSDRDLEKRIRKDAEELREDAIARAEKAEAELVELHAFFAGNVHAERNQLRAELTTERARLDWVFRNCKVTADDYTTGNRDVYAIHDREDLGAAMKGDAK